MSYRYIFYIPHYKQNSNGVANLWEAAFLFSKSRKVIICSFHNGVSEDSLPKKYRSLKILYGDDVWRIKLNQKDIVVYPDCVADNPFNHPNVARYLMCKPFLLNGIGYNLNMHDYVFAYSKAVSNILPQYTVINPYIHELKPLPNKIRSNKVVIYYGKVRSNINYKGLSKLLDNFDEIEIFTRSYPSTKEEMYRIISESRLLISLDPLSSLCHESTILGTPVYIYDDVFKNQYKNFNFKIHGFYYGVTADDLVNIYEDSKDLSTKAIMEVRRHELNQESNTSELIHRMESFVSENRNSFDLYNSNLQDDIYFFKNKWKYASIFNIISRNSLLRYHIINRFKILGISLIIFNRIMKDSIRGIKDVIRRIKDVIEYCIHSLNPITYLKSHFQQDERDMLKTTLNINKNLDNKLQDIYSIKKDKIDFILEDKKRNKENKTCSDLPDVVMREPGEKIKVTRLIKFFWK